MVKRDEDSRRQSQVHAQEALLGRSPGRGVGKGNLVIREIGRAEDRRIA